MTSDRVRTSSVSVKGVTPTPVHDLSACLFLCVIYALGRRVHKYYLKLKLKNQQSYYYDSAGRQSGDSNNNNTRRGFANRYRRQINYRQMDGTGELSFSGV